MQRSDDHFEWSSFYKLADAFLKSRSSSSEFLNVEISRKKRVCHYLTWYMVNDRSVVELASRLCSTRALWVQCLGWLSPSTRHKQHFPPTVMVVGDFKIIFRLFVSQSFSCIDKLSVRRHHKDALFLFNLVYNNIPCLEFFF